MKKFEKIVILPEDTIKQSMKQIAEETSFAYYECAEVDANLKGGKIISINKELKVLQWVMITIISLQKF